MVRMRYGLIVVTLLLGCGSKKNENAAAGGSGSPSAAAAAQAPTAPSPGTAPAGTGAAAPGVAAPGAGAPAAGGEDPWEAKGGVEPSGAVAAEDEIPTPTEPDDDEPTAAAGGGIATAGGATRAALIAKWCEKVSTCGCPEENCEEGYAKIAGTPASMYACFNAQSCATACEPNAGAPGTVLFNTCMKGKVGNAPAGGGGGVAKRCARQSDCGGGYDCCSGLCYQMGTSLWITACQMPTGKF